MDLPELGAGSETANKTHSGIDEKAAKPVKSSSGIGVYERTPEQEAYRLLKLREAIKGKPQSDESKDAKRRAMVLAWAEGRAKPRHTLESIKRAADKKRGTVMPRDVVERIRLKNTGKKRTPEMVEAMRLRVIAGYAAGKYRTPPEKIAERNRKISEAKKGWKQTGEQRLRHSIAMTGRVWPKDVVESRAEKLRERVRTAEGVRADESNINGLKGALRDDRGRLWQFKNLSHFVRTHRDLFDEFDTVERPQKKGGFTKTCRAIKGLSTLFAIKHTRGSWKGWTAVSGIELGEDLMARNTLDESEFSDTKLNFHGPHPSSNKDSYSSPP